MKVYSAYRSNDNYPSTRLTKVFENTSLLGLFQSYYDYVKENSTEESDNEYDMLKDFWGAQIYGSGWCQGIFEKNLQRPESIKDVVDALNKCWYTNEVVGSEHCIQVYTDDDEIDLCWYIFDEDYATENPEKTMIYIDCPDNLPADTISSGDFSPKSELLKITPAGKTDGCTYMVFVAVYDGGVIEDLSGGAAVKGVRLPEFLDWLRENTPACKDWSYENQLKYLAHIAREYKDDDKVSILRKWCSKPLSDFSQNHRIEEIFAKPYSQYDEKDFRCNPEKSRLNIHEHLWELSANGGYNYYDYFVFFDDVWAASHPLIAENLLRFGSGPEL